MKHTVKSSDEIQELFSTGKRIKTRGFILIFSPQKGRDPRGRVAFIAGKKLGSAPKRSYCKRVLRHMASTFGTRWPGYDVVFVAKAALMSTSFDQMCADCKEALEKAGILSLES